VIEAIQRRLAARSDEEREGGFTLIELMVVVMIIAILVGIAIPAFLGARKRAQDTASKSNLRNGLSTAQTVFTDNQSYGTTAELVAALALEEPSLTFVANTVDSGKAKEVSVETLQTTVGATLPYDELVLVAASGSGKCFFLRHIGTAGIMNTAAVPITISGSFMASTDTNTACSADDAPDHNAAAWKAL
jgi:prepilin-type N-terminal cleavage/methylation domain-containing protein